MWRPSCFTSCLTSCFTSGPGNSANNSVLKTASGYVAPLLLHLLPHSMLHLRPRQHCKYFGVKNSIRSCSAPLASPASLHASPQDQATLHTIHGTTEAHTYAQCTLTVSEMLLLFDSHAFFLTWAAQRTDEVIKARAHASVTNTLLKMEGGQWKWDLQRLLQPAEY